MDASVQTYIDDISADNRPLFDRINGLILGEFPEAETYISYNMPTYKVGDRRLYVATWKHGVSFYGWEQGRDAGFVERHPTLSSGKGTIKLRPVDAVGIADDELIDLIRGALAA